MFLNGWKILNHYKMALHTIINPANYVHIPEHSCYNANYYRNIETGDILFEEFGSSEDCASYYNLGQNPSFTNEDFINAEFLGNSECSIDFVGMSSNEEFEIDTEWC
jgi:hypothetical protein